MFKQSVLDTVSKFFPDVKIAYKDQSALMKFLGAILFFTPQFKTGYTTTLGSTIYYPSTAFIDTHPVSAFIVLLHELLHVSDEHKISKPLFSISYLLPQLLFLPALLLFLISWKIAIPVVLLCLLPLPAPFRMIFEKRAYMASLYTMNKLNTKNGYHIDLNTQKDYFLQQFRGSSYYFVWPFNNLNKEFDAALQKIVAGERPYDDEVFDILDQIIAVF